MVSIGLALNNVGYTGITDHIITGTANITSANWSLFDPGFEYQLLTECREGSESGTGLGIIEKKGPLGPSTLTDSLDFQFSVDESKTNVIIATLINFATKQVLRRVVQSVPPSIVPPPPNGPPLPLPWPFGDIPIEYLIVGAGLVLVVVAAVVMSPQKKR